MHVQYCGIGLVANGKRPNLSAKNFIVFVSCMTITSCFSDCDINIDSIITTAMCVIITLQ